MGGILFGQIDEKGRSFACAQDDTFPVMRDDSVC